LAAFLDQLYAHQRVLIEERARRRHVGTDAADNRGEMNDDLRPRVGEHATNRVPFTQIALCRARRIDARDVVLRDLIDHTRTEEP